MRCIDAIAHPLKTADCLLQICGLLRCSLHFAAVLAMSSGKRLQHLLCCLCFALDHMQSSECICYALASIPAGRCTTMCARLEMLEILPQQLHDPLCIVFDRSGDCWTC